MTKIYFTYAGHKIPDGRHVVHLYIRQEKPTYDQPLRSERKAEEDAALIVRDLVKVNVTDDPDRMLRDGDIPKDAVRVCQYYIIVRWDRKSQLPVYSYGDYERFEWDSKWNPIAKLMMEQREYIMTVLRSRVNADKKKRRQKMEKFMEEHK